MAEVAAAMVKDLRRYARDPIAFALWLGIPLIVGGLLILISGGDEPPKPQVHLLVADGDDTVGSRLLLAALDQAQIDMFHVEAVDAAEGEARMERGEASALLVIPGGFAEAVLREEPTTLRLVTNPSQRIAPGMIEECLELLQDAVFYAHRLVPAEIREVFDRPSEVGGVVPDATVAGISIAINHAVRRFGRYLDPPVIELRTASSEKKEVRKADDAHFSFAFLPGMLLMGLLFSSQGLSDDLWRERQAGTLRRAATTPMGVARLLCGKVLACVVILALIAAIALAAGFSYFGLPWSRFPACSAWSVGVGVLLLGLMFFVQTLATTQRAASVLGYLVVFPLMMLGGAMFPFELMPDWLAAIGRLTPNGWALQQLKALLMAKAGPLPLSAAVPLLLVASLVLHGAAGLRVRRVFARS